VADRIGQSCQLLVGRIQFSLQLGETAVVSHDGILFPPHQTFFHSTGFIACLDGDRAPLVTELSLKNLPSGEYTVAAELRDSTGGRTIVRRTVIVLSRLGETQ